MEPFFHDSPNIKDTGTINKLNAEYRIEFDNVSYGLYKRLELTECIGYINKGEHFIIQGNAGRGKSGLTENIIEELDNNTALLAIKLDKRPPKNNLEQWSKDLGFSTSMIDCLNYVDLGKKCVLILDQLDVLRWTNAHSCTALKVCKELINNVEMINKLTPQKITIIFVCRIYDLENDRSIKTLFESDNKDNTIKWNKVTVNDLTDEESAKLVGDTYHKFNIKDKKLLNIFSNIYILQKIKNYEKINECISTSNLIDKWWCEIVDKGERLSLNEKTLREDRNTIIKAFKKSRRSRIPRKGLAVNDTTIRHLNSNGFIKIVDDKISFTHQSILDYLLAEEMFVKYNNKNSIEEIVGEKQYPTVRFQFQIFMQLLLDDSPQDFIYFGRDLLESDKIRYSFKVVFYEVLSQVDFSNSYIEKYILENCDNEDLINTSIIHNPLFIRLLLTRGILYKWVNDELKRQILILMLRKISIEYQETDIDFIKKYFRIIFSSEVNNVDVIFSSRIFDENELTFSFRMELYAQHPNNMAISMTEIIKTFNKNQKRAVLLIKLYLEKYETINKVDLLKHFTMCNGNAPITISEPEAIINLLLPLVPKYYKYQGVTKWSEQSTFGVNLERYIVHVIKESAKSIAEKTPEKFFGLFKAYIGNGSIIHNETILYALQFMNTNYSDQIIEYISADLDSNAFDLTSHENNELTYAKKIIGIHSKTCSKETFYKLEKILINYIKPGIVESAKSCFELRRKSNYYGYHYHGELQMELLPTLDKKRISSYASEYEKILNRKFDNGTHIFNKYTAVTSCKTEPVFSHKSLNDKDWVSLLTNAEYSDKKLIGDEFECVVANETDRFIKLYLKHQTKILAEYIKNLRSGIKQNNNISNETMVTLERLVLSLFELNNDEHILCLIEIVFDHKDYLWSNTIMDKIAAIALYSGKETICNSTIKNCSIKELCDSQSLAMLTLASTSKTGDSFFNMCKNIIDKNIDSPMYHIKYSVSEMLKNMWSFDESYAAENIIKMCKDDISICCNFNLTGWLYKISKNYDIDEIVLKLFRSDDDEQMNAGVKLATILFLENNCYEELICSQSSARLAIKKSLINSAVSNYDNPYYNEKCKNIIKLYQSSEVDLEISKLFYDKKINLENDKGFILEIKKTGLYTMVAFADYITTLSTQLSEFSEIILALCEQFISSFNSNDSYATKHLSELLLSLFDETSSNDFQNEITEKCLDLLDIMFEKNIGNTRKLIQQITDR